MDTLIWLFTNKKTKETIEGRIIDITLFNYFIEDLNGELYWLEKTLWNRE